MSLYDATPGMVHAHRIVRCDRSVDEREASLALIIAMEILLDDPVSLPPFEQITLHCRKIDLTVNVLESHVRPLKCNKKPPSKLRTVKSRGTTSIDRSTLGICPLDTRYRAHPLKPTHRRRFSVQSLEGIPVCELTAIRISPAPDSLQRVRNGLASAQPLLASRLA